MNTAHDKLSGIIGRKVVRANSSLNQFAIELSGDRCLILDAINAEWGPTIEPLETDSGQYPSGSDAVCAVDWSWIYGGEVTAVKALGDQVRLTLAPQGPLTVSVGTWQGKPFLSFMPYKPPAR